MARQAVKRAAEYFMIAWYNEGVVPGSWNNLIDGVVCDNFVRVTAGETGSFYMASLPPYIKYCPA